MKDFAGRTAFVTGGANGVGIGLVRALLAEGCNVAIADIRSESIDAALASLRSPKVMGALIMCIDLPTVCVETISCCKLPTFPNAASFHSISSPRQYKF